MSFHVRYFPPRRFKTLASKLLADTDPEYDAECKARTAMGRFYYAALLIAHQKLNQQGIIIPNSPTIHRDVITAFNEQNATIGSLLDQLREKRVDADYYMDSQINVGIVKRYEQITERVIALIDQWRAT
ncbi:MAG: hypothetical protein ABSA75_09280 [Candidatus Bathyarchaeia archaeon]|jgi:hypothetical protein